MDPGPGVFPYTADPQWVFTSAEPGIEIDVIGSTQDVRCSPIGAMFSDNHGGGPPPTIYEVMGWGPDCCPCSPDITEVCLSALSGETPTPYDATLTGSLCSPTPSFTDGLFTLEWNGEAWTLTTPYGSNDLTHTTGTRCDPVGETFTNGTYGTSDWWSAEITNDGPCVECETEQTEICVRMRFASNPEYSYATLTGSLVDGLFTGSGVVLYWDGHEWQAGEYPEEQIASTGRCNPYPRFISFNTYGGPLQWDIEVLGFGPGCCECAPNYTEVTVDIVNIDDEPVDTITLTGSTCDGIFSAPPGPVTGTITLAFLGGEWVLSDDTWDVNTTATSPITDPCNPAGVFTGDSSGDTYTVTIP